MREFVADSAGRYMTALPIELIPGTPALEAPFWTPLRVALTLAWVAALLALAAVGLGGWSLLELSERRIGFVSAVTHELRTPMTTLRLYLDMLSGGMVKDEQQKTEYLHTLNQEADRLDRLIGNVLDFSRLEKQKPRLEQLPHAVSDLLGQVHSSWESRCLSLGKELVIDDQLPEGTRVTTDARIVQQILSSLVDNACKYSRDAEDRRIWLRARRAGSQIVLEVEDRGPGVAKGEARSIFRPFRRGRGTETMGGVGLGLALAQRWARLLHGTLAVAPAGSLPGACFQLSLPAS
jgi:signal transduction histidine kinase